MKERALELLKVIEADISANRLILPSLPEVAIRIRRQLGDPNCSVQQLEHHIAKDAAMAARLMKVANSAAMTRGQPVTSLRQAINSLGFSLVGSLVTQMAILQTMKTSRDVARLEGFVAGSLRISSLCHSIASRFGYLDAELASLGGLLHDIGKLPLREFLFENPDFTGDERLQYELILHPYTGALLLKHWQMTEELVQMAFFHERVLRESPGEQPDYVDVVIAANLMHYGLEKGRYEKFADKKIPALEKCTLNQDLGSLEGTVEERMEMALFLIGG